MGTIVAGTIMLKFFVAGAALAFGLVSTSVVAAPRKDDCADCPISKKYDSEEVIKKIRNIDHSRVINTTVVVPAARSIDEEPRRDRDVKRVREDLSYREEKRADRRRVPESRRSVVLRSYGCADCAPRKKYDSEEVVKKVRNIDNSRVINTRTVVPGRTRIKETNHLVIHKNETRHVGVVQHNRIIVEKEIRYFRRVPARTRVEFITHDYRVVERPDTVKVYVPARAPGYIGPCGRYGSCRSLLRVRG